MQRIPAADVITAVCDQESFQQWSPADLGIPQFHPDDADYRAELATAREVTGQEESVRVGQARVSGNSVVLVVGDFDFLAGSAGRRTCQLVIGAIDFAIEHSLPVIASPTSGGTRMQEGTPAFLLMADVANACARLRDAGQLLVVWLRHPTTGGVMATWGSLGTVTFGQPDALAGFLGPRVFEMLEGSPFPSGVQQSENLADHGVIDGVIPLTDLRTVVARLVGVTVPSQKLPDPMVGIPVQNTETDTDRMPRDTAHSVAVNAWDNVLATRDPSRIGARELIAATMSEVVTLSGTGEGQRSSAITVKIGRWLGQPVVVVAQDRIAQANGQLVDPAALKTARRAFRVAGQLGLPLVTIVDTPGAELSTDAEEGGLAGQIARCLAELTTLKVPTVSVLLGMGCGGGAIALLPTDVVIAAQNAWVAPLPLEGASVIRHRTPERASDMADQQRVTAADMLADGIVDVVVSESPMQAPDGDPDEVPLLADGIGAAVTSALADLTGLEPSARDQRRQSRYHGGLHGA